MITSQKENCQKLWNSIPKQYNIESIKLKKKGRLSCWMMKLKKKYSIKK
jgi:hypothetical protein